MISDSVVYLVYKGGSYKELSKRNPETKHLLARAEETMQATKDAARMYHVGKYPTRWVSELQRFALISEMESAVYDMQVKIRTNGKKEEVTD